MTQTSDSAAVEQPASPSTSQHPGRRRRVIVIWSAVLLVVVVVVIVLVGIFSRPQLNQVEVRAQGGLSFTVTFADDSQSYTEEWMSTGWKQFTTTTSSAQITVTAPADSPKIPVSCQILWNGKTVVEQVSDTGTATCRYDAK